MPELPEVETVRTGLNSLVVGRTITGLRVGQFAGVVGELGVNATGARIVGRRITGVQRRAKYLFLTLDDETHLSIHLRMTGTVQVVSRQTPPLRFEHLAIELDDGSDIRFADQRKFGRVIHLDASGFDRQDALLGPEPLEEAFTPDVLASRLAGRTAPIKAALLDQRRIAGLGNIYVDEALFRARVHPLQAAGSLSLTAIHHLHASIQAVLREAIERRGTTFSSFATAYGDAGANGPNLRVYGRGRRAEPCLDCGTPLALLTVAGRSTHYCPDCQPMTRSNMGDG